MKLEKIISKHNIIFVYFYCEEEWCKNINNYIFDFFNSKCNGNISFHFTRKENYCHFLPCLELYFKGKIINETFCIDNCNFKKYLNSLYTTSQKLS